MLIYNFGDWTEWLQPQKATFLPEQKLIKIHPGESQIDVQVDLYSAWKEWIRYYDNAKWAAAFTTFGGDPTGESQYAPKYFFLTNGWKIYVANMSLVVQTNLYSDDGLSPFIIDNAAVTNRASDVPIIKSEIEKRLDYGDRIYYDENSTYTGTDYPNGTIAQPINNLSDAISISNLYNIKNFYMLSDVNITSTGNIFQNYSIFADRENLTLRLIDGNLFNNMEWVGFIVDGYFGGGINKFVDCTIINAFDVSGQMKSCQMNGTTRVWNDLVMSNCYSGVAGYNTPIYDMNINRITKLSIRSYSGGVDILNCNQDEDISTVELIAGQIKIQPTCTKGYIDVRGVGYITNNSSGTTVKTIGFIDSFENYIEESRLITERTTYGDKIYIDETSQYTGTTYPLGTIGFPINNLFDAITITNQYNITDFYALSNIYINNLTGLTIEDYSFFADRENLTFKTTGNTFRNVDINGFIVDIDFGGGSGNKLNECVVKNALNISGRISNSQMGTSQSKSTVKLSHEVILSNCYSGVVAGVIIDNTPVYDMANIDSYLAIRSYSGGVKIVNQSTSNSKSVVELIAGHIKLDSTCTNGYIDIRGVGYISSNNASTDCTIITTGFVDSFGKYIEDTRIIDEQLAYGGKIYVDQISGSTGITYPTGTIVEPVKDPFYLSNKLNIKEFWITSDYTYQPTEYTKDITLIASHPNINLTILNGQYVDKSKFIGFYILDSQFDGNFNTLDKCIVFKSSNFNGHMYDTEIWGTVSVHTHLDLWRCWADHYADISTTTEHTEIGVVGWYGDLILKNTNINDEVLLNINSGKITIESGCTNGIIDIRGVGYMIDNSSGATVITTGFVSQTLTSEDVYKLTGITSAIDDMTIAVESLDDKVSYISGTTYEMNQNVIFMTSGFTDIENSMIIMTDSIINIMNGMITIEQQVQRILGLSQENFRIMNHTYSNNNLDSATVKIYNNNTDCNNDTNALATYSMIALYDSAGRLIDYKVTKN